MSIDAASATTRIHVPATERRGGRGRARLWLIAALVASLVFGALGLVDGRDLGAGAAPFTLALDPETGRLFVGTWNDGTIVTRQLEQQVGRSPVRLITHPRPMFVVANTHSTKATNDLGRFVGGIVPNTAACGFGVSPLTDPSFVDTALCQEDWANNLLGSEIAIDSSRPRLTARNADVLEPGHFDYESTIERYLRRLGLFAAHYRSSLAGNPCAGTGALECTAFVQASAERCLTGGGTSYFREPVTGQAPEHLAMQAVQWTWDQGSGRAAAYLEVSGGQHAVPGRGRACGAPGLTHDVDAATQFLVFMAQHGGLVQR